MVVDMETGNNFVQLWLQSYILPAHYYYVHHNDSPDLVKSRGKDIYTKLCKEQHVKIGIAFVIIIMMKRNC